MQKPQVSSKKSNQHYGEQTTHFVTFSSVRTRCHVQELLFQNAKAGDSRSPSERRVIGFAQTYRPHSASYSRAANAYWEIFLPLLPCLPHRFCFVLHLFLGYVFFGVFCFGLVCFLAYFLTFHHRAPTEIEKPGCFGSRWQNRTVGREL